MKAQTDSGEIFTHTGWRVSGMAHIYELLNPVRIPVMAIANNIRAACQISTFLPLIIGVKIAAAGTIPHIKGRPMGRNDAILALLGWECYFRPIALRQARIGL